MLNGVLLPVVAMFALLPRLLLLLIASEVDFGSIQRLLLQLVDDFDLLLFRLRFISTVGLLCEVNDCLGASLHPLFWLFGQTEEVCVARELEESTSRLPMRYRLWNAQS